MADASELVQKLEQAREQKEIGTAALQFGEPATALRHYVDAIALLAIAHERPASANEELLLLWNECVRQGLKLELACHLNSALCLVKLERWTEAVDAAGEAVRMDGKSAKAHFRRGVARAGAGQDEEAAADLLKAAKLAPQDDAIRRELATVKARLAIAAARCQPSAATAALSAAMANSGTLYPDAPDVDTPEARANLIVQQAEQLRTDGKHDEGLEQCKRVFRLLRPGSGPAELGRQRFQAHVIAAQCYKADAASTDSAQQRSNSLKRAVANLESAVAMLAGAFGEELCSALGEARIEQARSELVLTQLMVAENAQVETDASVRG